MITKLIAKLRSYIEDEGTQTSQTFVYSSSAVFTLAQDAQSVSQVLINGVVTSNYSFNAAANTVTITENLTMNDVIIVTYSYYCYTDVELTGKIKLAVNDLMVYNETDKNYEVEGDNIYEIPSLKEQNLIVKIAYIRLQPNLQEYNTPALKIKYATPKDVDEKIAALITHFYDGSEFGGTLSL